MSSEDEKPDFIATPHGTPIQRTRGCWNCKHWDNQDKCRSFWSARRQSDLAQILIKANKLEDGESDPSIVNLRHMINNVDIAVAKGTFGICLINKADADLVHNAYLCDNWSGAAGSSLVTSGTAPDKLPEELKEEAEAEASSNFIKKKKED